MKSVMRKNDWQRQGEMIVEVLKQVADACLFSTLAHPSSTDL